MAAGDRRPVPPDALVGPRRRPDVSPGRHPDRAGMVRQAAALHGASPTTLHRRFRDLHRPHRAPFAGLPRRGFAPDEPRRRFIRADRGLPREPPLAEMERWCEIIAALDPRTTNKKGRHLSTARALEAMERYGVETPDGLVRLPPGALTRPTADRRRPHRPRGGGPARLLEPAPPPTDGGSPA